MRVAEPCGATPRVDDPCGTALRVDEPSGAAPRVAEPYAAEPRDPDWAFAVSASIATQAHKPNISAVLVREVREN